MQWKNKLGAAIADPVPGNNAVDIRGGIISRQSDVFTTTSPDSKYLKFLFGGVGRSSEDVYNNIDAVEAGGEDLPPLSAKELRHLVTRIQDEQLPALSENGFAELTQGINTNMYDPEKPGDPKSN